MTNDETPKSKWVARADTANLVFTAVRSALCWTIGVLLIIFDTAAAYYGHHVDPVTIPVIGGLIGFPFLWGNRP